MASGGGGIMASLMSLIYYALLLGVLAALVLAGLFFANQHVRAQRKAKNLEKANNKRQAQAIAQAGAAASSSPSAQPRPISATDAKPVPAHRFNVTASSSASVEDKSPSRQSVTPMLSVSATTKQRASMLIHNTKEFAKKLAHKEETAPALTAQAVSSVKRGMRKRLASFKLKQAPKIKEHMNALGFETSFNPLFEAGFSRMENMVFEDPDLEAEQIALVTTSSGKQATLKRNSSAHRALAAPVLAGAYAMDSPSKSMASNVDMDEQEQEEEEEEGEDEVIWLEGMYKGKLCWEDIDTGELVSARPSTGTITNQTTLDTMMSEGTTPSGVPKYSTTYLEMRQKFKVTEPRNAHSRHASSGALDEDEVKYVNYDEEDEEEEEEQEEEIRQLDEKHRQAVQGMLGS